MSETWKCPKCGEILIKGMRGGGLFSSGTIIGTATCSNCGAQFQQSDVYGGKYDVSLSSNKSAVATPTITSETKTPEQEKNDGGTKR